MYGRFTTTQLQKYAKEQGARLRREQQQREEQQQTDDEFRTYDNSFLAPVKSKEIPSPFLHFKSTVHPALASRGFASHIVLFI